jgi:hypothetical protein
MILVRGYDTISAMKPGTDTQKTLATEIIRLMREMRLEAAVRLLKHAEGEVDSSAVRAVITEYGTQASRMQADGETGEARRLARRAAALKGILLHGPNPAKMVAETELPEGYVGKVLMMRVDKGGFDDMLILRSGDGWHREILANTRAEIVDLGFSGAEVYPLGGAYAGFGSGGAIVIWGTSDEYGCCDKEEACRMIARAYPGRSVRIED